MKKIELFVSPVCPYCPQARKLFQDFARDNPSFKYTEVDTYTEQGIERGMSLQVMAVPCVVVDDAVTLTGWPFGIEDLKKIHCEQ